MRMRVRPILMALAVTATTMALTAGQAAAGGPTSVLVVNPMTGETGALYVADSNYQVLEDALAPAARISVERPPQLSGGPGTPAINITWLIHDVSVWRVDRVRLDLKYVWVQTNLLADGTTPFDGSGEWHVAADPDAVLEVLGELGVLPDTGVPDVSSAAAGSLDGVAGLGVNEPFAAADDRPVAATPAPTVPGWQWIAVAAAGGIAIGAVGRPTLASTVWRRTAGPRQQLIDLEPPESSEQNSGQADPDPAKAPALVFDLGDLYPADLPR
jgi:hypothetical protein